MRKIIKSIKLDQGLIEKENVKNYGFSNINKRGIHKLHTFLYQIIVL